MFGEWICLFSLIFYLTGRFKLEENRAETEIHCRCVYVFIPLWRFQLVQHSMVGGVLLFKERERERKKRREKKKKYILQENTSDKILWQEII